MMYGHNLHIYEKQLLHRSMLLLIGVFSCDYEYYKPSTPRSLPGRQSQWCTRTPCFNHGNWYISAAGSSNGISTTYGGFYSMKE